MAISKPLISAIVSTYNSEKFIRGKIEDLLNQTIFDQIEMIIVNSGSSQNEDSIIKEFLGKLPNITYIHTVTRETIYKAWNRAIKVSNGKYITNSNTDDRLRPDALEVLSNELDRNPNIALIYADQYVTAMPNEKFNFNKESKIIRMPDFDRVIQLEKCIVFSQSMWRASLHYKDNIWFDDELEICGDHEFEMNISRKYEMKHINDVLGSFYKSPNHDNKSFQNIPKIDFERKVITLKYMNLYVNESNNESLIHLLKKFRLKILLPMLLSRIIIRLQSILITEKHVFSQEFIFLLTIMIYNRFGEKEKALKLSKKYLNHRSSWRIEKKYKELNDGSYSNLASN